jgi:putative FmdB family regulatory protein
MRAGGGKLRAVPLYDYAPKSGRCAQCKGRFEVVQKLSEPHLERCPHCDKPVERVISAAAIGGKYVASNSKVRDLGMTKYVKTSDGAYARVAGQGGPKLIRKPED